jgi:peptidoglycan/LPS O-acetylase OafA/YrhL
MSAAGLAVEESHAAASPAVRASYRADIDGLRAIAVLAVIFTHAGIPGFGGGFVGVDVFFVISGFLITRNLENARQARERGLWPFYARRLRRTLPALYLVAFVTLAAGLALLLPGDLNDLAHSVIAILLFVPNIFFLNQTGYFDHAAVTKPLLHTWSLGVEEQFYLLAPLLPFGLRRFGPFARKAVLIGLFALGLAGCAGLRAVAPAAAFYLMPARLWEFLAGCLVAEAVFPPIATRWQAEAVSGAALLGLAAAIGTFSAATAHPGLPTLLPCLATAALIHVGGTHTTLAGRLLGSRLVAGIGLISYSLYLWHWPLLFFVRTADWHPLSLAAQITAGAALLGLSVLTWRFVEMPFRASGSLLRRHAPRILPPAAALLAAASSVVIVARGLPARFPPEVAALAAYDDYIDRRQFREGECFITSKYGDAALFDRQTCLHQVAGRENYLIIGDSHAAHLWTGFNTVFSAANVMQATASGCRPLLESSGTKYCTGLMQEVMQVYLPQHPVEVIILAAAWEFEDAGHIAETVAYLARYARKVVVVGHVPKHALDLPQLLSRSILEHNEPLILREQLSYPFEIDRLFKKALPAANYVSLLDGLCPQDRCIVYAAPGVPLQFDTSHFTTEGSILAARYIDHTNALKGL